MARFIDIASHQDVTNPDLVADTDVAGAWVKLTGELGYENPKRDQQVNGLRGSGLAVGGYHFGDPRVDAAGQARHFGQDAERLGLLDHGSLFPMFDAENVESVGLKWSSPAQLNHYIGTWEATLRGEFGVQDYLVYGSESWWGSWIDPRVWGDANAWNWVANYNGRPGVLKAWAHPQDALHQWRSNAVPFPGISANGLDDNVTLNGHTRESLTIGKTGGWLMSLSDNEQQEILRAARKINAEYNPVDDDRPLPISTPDDVVGHVLSVRGLQEKMRNAQAIDRTAIANIETVVNRIDQRDANAGMSDEERAEFAQQVAAQIDGVSQQDIINAFRNVNGTVTFKQVPSGG